AHLIDTLAPDEELMFRVERNLEPLFINTVNSWSLRPNARTEIENLFLASDYIKTRTDLATMEGANEAARWAVNGLLQDMEEKGNIKLKRCRLFEFDEPEVFAPFRRIDKWLFDRGLPHHPFSRTRMTRPSNEEDDEATIC